VLKLAVNHDRCRVDIGLKAPVGALLGVAYVMPGLGFFTASVAFHV